MDIIYYLIFFGVSWMLLMVVFGFSTYHRSLAWALPLLIAYSSLVGYLLFRFGLHGGFLWHIAISIFLLARGFSHQSAQIKNIMAMTDVPDDLRVISESGAKTMQCYVLSSVVYLVSFATAYLYFYNQNG